MPGRRTSLSRAREQGGRPAVAEAIREALLLEGGHVGRAAVRLGISRSALYRAARVAGVALSAEAVRLRP